MNVRTCPSAVELERAFFVTDAAVRAHVDGCSTCSATWREIDALRALSLSLAVALEPILTVTEKEAHQALRAQVVANAGAPRRPSWSLLRRASIAVASIAALVVLIDRWPVSPPIHRGRVHAITDAKYWTVSGPPDEVVRLVHGSIGVAVAELAPNERFRVVTGHGEVEVRGTIFDVVAKDDRLESVQVHSGAVEVRTELEARLIRAGHRWTAATPATAEVVIVAPAAPQPLREEKAAKIARRVLPVQKDRPVVEESPGLDQRAYEAGWMSLRTGDHRQAAAQFEAVLEHTSDSSLEQDARYFLAVSLARAKDADRAMETFESFLAKHASSPRAGEAAAALGWLRYDHGQHREAEALFQRAVESGAARARASGLDGLEALRRNRARTGSDLGAKSP